MKVPAAVEFVFIRVIGIAALPLEQLPAEAVALALSIGLNASATAVSYTHLTLPTIVDV